MTEETETIYDHDAAVRAITSYYDFLEKLYLPPDILVRPPLEGWAQITAESVPFRKDEKVIRLLKYIPYFEQRLWDDEYCLARKTWPIQWNNVENVGVDQGR